MLRRALQSLIQQTQPEWKACVFDDSADREGADVVKAIGDPRVQYVANRAQLGAAENIDACFGKRCDRRCIWGCVLEDDNFFLPEFLAHVSKVMAENGVDLGLFNQRIQTVCGDLAPEDKTTRGKWFSNGWVNALDLHASLLVMEGLSNGGLVWRIGAKPRLQVGGSVQLTALHESCRSLLVKNPFWFSRTALAVWSELPRNMTARHGESNRMIGRGSQSIVRFLLKQYGFPCVTRALALSPSIEARQILLERLLHAGAVKKALRVDAKAALGRCRLVLKGAALRWTVADPCREFLESLSASGTFPI
jgi:hypothetical protein